MVENTKDPEVKSSSLSKPEEKPRLIHPSLHKVPMQVRFLSVGAFGNILFMYAYNIAVINFEDRGYAPSTIYSITYAAYIPVGHFLTSILVFGWPKQYFASLLSNFPIGITAIMLGATCTAYLDQIGFEDMADDWIDHKLLGKPVTPEEEKGEFYSSLVVMIITSVWTYVLSVMVNSPSSPPDKKEL
eukprot:CAMPEP_0194033772 /NCGR_PEP_ID=MMETSP0009_2-20130614/6317_1 /TAXON_ID=210454 /ORGANISM="Grammatophora oceanica, Strain CCMP 410" /LENGTH=186 /DNA_ID=CAMNT_0038674493 /DNA_START=188 /DNA_END=748 /DNA_ORIENTATION=-